MIDIEDEICLYYIILLFLFSSHWIYIMYCHKSLLTEYLQIVPMCVL